jgi:hypothetical protein
VRRARTRRPWGALGGVLLALGLAGCSGEGAAEVGDPCEDGNACAFRTGSACILSWPDGYCTEVGCTLGSCPTGARCVTGIQFADVSYESYCLSTCDRDGDCRDGYRCVDVSLPEMVCAP